MEEHSSACSCKINQSTVCCVCYWLSCGFAVHDRRDAHTTIVLNYCGRYKEQSDVRWSDCIVSLARYKDTDLVAPLFTESPPPVCSDELSRLCHEHGRSGGFTLCDDASLPKCFFHFSPGMYGVHFAPHATLLRLQMIFRMISVMHNTFPMMAILVTIAISRPAENFIRPKPIRRSNYICLFIRSFHNNDY